MTITVTFDQRYRIWEAAAQDASRPALQCVLIDPSGVLVAADGFLMGIVKADIGELDKPILVKAEAFMAAASVKSLDGQAHMSLNLDARLCAVEMGTHTRTWPFYDGGFPRWRELVPDFAKLTFGIPVGGYSATLLAKAQAVAGGMGVTGGGQSKEQPFVVVDAEDKALVVVMPMFYSENIVMKSVRTAYRKLGLMKSAEVPVG